MWWDGWTIASNLSEQDAEATFKVMVQAISPDMMKDNAQKAVWLIEGYEPDASAMGVISTVQQQANPYPMLPYMGLLHSALGAELPDFLLEMNRQRKRLKMSKMLT